MLTWTTGFIAAHTLYRYHRVLDAIILVGVAMVVNMSATYTDLFGHLLLFVAAAMLLWLRASLLTRQEGWQRRRVNENLEVPLSIMRSGVVFAGGTIVLAWILTTVAVAAPLSDAWRGMDTVWSGVRDSFEGVFGSLTNPHSRISGDTFGSSFTVSGTWVSNDQEVMVVAATRPLYMRTATYDVYTGRGWERGEGSRRSVAPGERVFPGPSPERPEAGEAFAVETVAIEMRQTIGRNLFTPGFPLRVGAPAVVYETGGQPLLGGLEAANAFRSGEAYQIVAALSEATEAELGGAGTAYPELITARYLDTGDVPARVRDLALTVVADAPDPYTQAKLLARFLQRHDSFEYATTAPVPDPGQDLVDFFLFDEEDGRVGYCQYYASAMVIMARSIGIPARVAVGFGPGERIEGEPGTFLVREANAHAWAELYFPGYGWQVFEATKTIEPQFSRVAGGTPLLPAPIAGREDNRLEEFEAESDLTGIVNTLPSPQLIEGGFDVTTGAPVPGDEERGGNAIVIVVLLAGVAIFLWVRMRRIQRRWRFLPAGERAWRRMALAAERAGVARRPAETFYEYAGWLEDQIPARRPEIRTIADGKVWQAYSGRPISSSAIGLLETAWRRLRVPFASLAIRRWLRNLIRRS